MTNNISLFSGATDWDWPKKPAAHWRVTVSATITASESGGKDGAAETCDHLKFYAFRWYR